MATALAANERGLDTLVVEKTPWVGGSTAKSGGAYWIPGNPALTRDGSKDTVEAGREYLEAVVGESAPRDRWEAFLDHGSATIEMLERTTPLRFFWARGYSDYHPENPGGAAVGRTCEAKPFNAAVLGDEKARLRPASLEAPIPMPITGADYKWMNLMLRKPLQAWPRIIRRAVQGVGGLAIRRDYMAGGQALAAGLFAGCIAAGIPIWTRTALTELIIEDGAVVGARVEQDGRPVEIRARKGVVVAAGGFDHRMDWRRKYQSESLEQDYSFGAEGNEGDAIRIAADELGAELTLMDQSWWFPAVKPLEPGGEPAVLLAERSLPGSMIVDETGTRFINEAKDYMSFGQHVLRLRAEGRPIERMWLVMDQRYRDRYVFAGSVFPMMPFPKSWYDRGIAVRGKTPQELAAAAGLPATTFTDELACFNQAAANGIDDRFHRGDSAYDRYYGDPTQLPNPNLRPLAGPLYAVEIVLGDLGTCGGLRADAKGRVLKADGQPITGLYAQGNTAGNVFGNRYPGAGATISQGLVFGEIIAQDAAGA